MLTYASPVDLEIPHNNLEELVKERLRRQLQDSNEELILNFTQPVDNDKLKYVPFISLITLSRNYTYFLRNLAKVRYRFLKRLKLS